VAARTLVAAASQTTIASVTGSRKTGRELGHGNLPANPDTLVKRFKLIALTLP
jgi:hypothetical protein